MILILTKQHNATGTAHLYEVAIHDIFHRHDLFPYVDYSLHTQTLEAGVVYVDVRFYTENARTLANEIKSLSVSRDTQSVAIAVTQVVAELGKAFNITKGLEEISEELRELDAQPWQEINDLDEIDPKVVTITAGSFYTLKNAEKVPTLDLSVNLTLDQDFANSHRELLPLFWQLARLMNASVKADFHSLIPVYSKEVVHTNTNKRTRLTHGYSLHHDIPFKVADALEMASLAISDLRQTGGIARFVENLRQEAQSDVYGLMPNPSTVFHQTGILIGAKGWQRIATDENCDLILSHMKVMISTGRNRISMKIGSILE